MNMPSAGSIWMTRIASMKVVRPRNRKRLIATDARNANSRQKNTAISVTATLMPSALKKELVDDAAVVGERAAERQERGRERLQGRPSAASTS